MFPVKTVDSSNVTTVPDIAEAQAKEGVEPKVTVLRAAGLPPPASGGTPQVKSPRQNVDEVAPVPPLKFPTAKLPVSFVAANAVIHPGFE